MMGWLMRRLPPGSFVWLVLHELRLAMLARREKRLARLLGWVILIAWTGAGIALGLALQGVRIDPGPIRMTAAAAASILFFTFMVTQAMLASQRTLYESGDLDLLFSAPMPPRTVVSAKLVGIAATVVLTFAFFILPVTLPMAVLGHPELFGIPALLLALALAAACFGLTLTLLLARIAGPRAARTVGQIVAALSGGAIFIASQLVAQRDDDGRRDGFVVLFERLVEGGLGAGWIGGLPGRAAFGDPVAVAVALGIGGGLFALTAWGMQTLFLSGYRAGGMKLARGRRARGGIARHFRRGLAAAVFAKEWRLLLRDPALAFQLVLRLVYMAPILLIAVREEIALAPSLAFSSVLIAGQMVGGLAWLAASAEDAPDLLKVAPVAKEEFDNAKLFAAMAMAAPLAAALPAAIAFETVAGALVALFFTTVTGLLTGYLEVAHARPSPRSAFQRRGSGSWALALFEFFIAAILGLMAGVVVHFIQLWF